MFEPPAISHEVTKLELYNILKRQVVSLLEGETDFIANSANFASLLFHSLPAVNWVGFYYVKTDDLVLGPLQGQPACVGIRIGKGVCGTAALSRTSIIVDNVHEFQGHIACDSNSNSEIVIPLLHNGILIGVLDIDSPIFNRFDEFDLKELEELTALLLHFSHL
ncbi:MAG: GAF domain-containing protein [Ignavibacteria bacterium]|nr:GAF domain-containing protein [Ignavibacteria bacterium]